MRIVGGHVYLEEGDKFPSRCSCGEIYAPKGHEQYSSECPKCHKRVNHADVKWSASEVN